MSQAFETEGLIGTGAAPAVLAICPSVESRLDGRPTLLIVDEAGWRSTIRTFGAQLREWLKTLRKKNASVVSDPVARRHRDQRQSRRHRRELPDAAVPANERAIEPQIRASIAASASMTGKIEILARQHRSATTTANHAAAIACSSSGSARIALALTPVLEARPLNQV